MLSNLFRRRPRPRTVVHAGSLLLRRRAGLESLRRYLRVPREREVFLVHQGQVPLREVAQDAGVMDISLEASARQEADAAAEMAVALGARRLVFTIDDPAVSRPDGRPVGEITVHEAERLARAPGLRPKVRAKLQAACAAIRHGLSMVRIGDPPALTRGEATTVVPDPTAPAALHELPQFVSPRSMGVPALAASALATAETDSAADPLALPWNRLRGEGVASAGALPAA
jgi:hypothetical protein